MKFLLSIATTALSLLASMPSSAQDASQSYPSKPVTLVVPAAPGGPTDVIARMLSERLATALGQPVLVDNKPGATQMLGTHAVARSNADGYTLLFAPSTPIVIVPFTIKQVPYDVKRDLVMVSHIGSTPIVLCTNTSTPVHSIKELVGMAKSNPGALSYSTWGNNSSGHLLGEYLGKQTGIQMIHVGYRGMGPAVSDLIAGQVTFGMADAGTAAPHIKGGKIRALAVAGNSRSHALPDVPTFAEQGIAGMEIFSPWFAVLAPKATPKPIVDKISAAIVRIVKMPDFSERLVTFGVTPTGLEAAESTALLNKELDLWQKTIRALPDIKFE